MAVKIDIDMPESCEECKLCTAIDFSYWKCELTKITFPTKFGEEERLSYCPLKECK